jgi:hypothetical protein
VQAVVVGIAEGAVLTVIPVGWIWTLTVVCTSRRACRDILVLRHDQMKAAQMLEANAHGCTAPQLLLDPAAAVTCVPKFDSALTEKRLDCNQAP